jgi:ATP-dependent protease HslVU (ClpYQ) peptidase subunit
VKHYTTWPRFRPDEDTDLEAYLVKRLVPAIRTAVAGHGIVEVDSGVESIPLTLLIAWGEHIAEVSGDGCALMPRARRYAIGSGYAEALGALGDAGPWDEADVVEAARRSTITAHGCDGPIYVADTVGLEVYEVLPS